VDDERTTGTSTLPTVRPIMDLRSFIRLLSVFIPLITFSEGGIIVDMEFIALIFVQVHTRYRVPGMQHAVATKVAAPKGKRLGLGTT
jgi:hypothetical protein